MSFLKNIVRNAVNDGISKGISKGISNAVSAAAEKIVAPKAEAYANKVAGSLDEATQAIDAASVAAAENAAAQNIDTSALEQSLNHLAQSAEQYAKAMEKAAASQEDLTKMWNERIPDFPVWCFGGTDFRFEENGTDAYGAPYYIFEAEGTTQEGLNLYVELLKQNGFVRKYSGSDEVLYKDLGGEYLLFGKTDAFGAAPVMSLAMYRTKDRHEIEICSRQAVSTNLTI